MGKTVTVYNAYDMSKVETFPSFDAAYDWIINRAAEWNYGMWRYWEMDGFGFYDVGPRTFAISLEDIEKSAD